MKRHLLCLLLIPTLIIGLEGCVSKKYAKRGGKYELAGMWESAAEAYMHSLAARRDNIDALVGLKRSGQKTIDEKTLRMMKAYESDGLKEAVYGYLDITAFRDRASAVGVELQVSDRATDYFNDAKPKYVDKIYAEAQALLDAEKFVQAEALLKEIQAIEPNYGNVQEMMKVSQCEPLYRQGKEHMNSGFSRRAYANFEKIIKEYGGYKDSRELREDALLNALITVKIDGFGYSSGSQEVTARIQGAVASGLNSLNNPFVKVVDTESTQKILEEQRRSLEVGSNIQIGKILAANAMLSATVVEFSQISGKVERVEKRGYLKEVTTVKNKATGEDEASVSYKKVLYHIVSGKNSSAVALKYRLTSVETGAVMVSDVARGVFHDEIRYAVFDGSADKLVPGYWERAGQDSEKDYVSDTPGEVQSLRTLLKAKRDITPAAQLTDKAIAEVAARVAQAVNRYNPEQ